MAQEDKDEDPAWNFLWWDSVIYMEYMCVIVHYEIWVIDPLIVMWVDGMQSGHYGGIMIEPWG